MQVCAYGLDTEGRFQVWHAFFTARAFYCTMFTFVMVLYQGALYQASNPLCPCGKISIIAQESADLTLQPSTKSISVISVGAFSQKVMEIFLKLPGLLCEHLLHNISEIQRFFQIFRGRRSSEWPRFSTLVYTRVRIPTRVPGYPSTQVPGYLLLECHAASQLLTPQNLDMYFGAS